MNLIELLRQEIKQPLTFFFLIALLSSASNALLIKTINSAVKVITNEEVSTRYFLLFIVLAGLYLLSKNYISRYGAEIVERVTVQLRKRLANKIRHTELSTLESVGFSSLYNSVLNDVLSISNASLRIIIVGQSILLILFILLYVLWLSLWSGILLFAGVLIGCISYIRYMEMYIDNSRKIWSKEAELVQKFSNIMTGFKEIRINSKKNKSVYSEYVKVNTSKLKIKLRLINLVNNNMLLAQFCFYITIAAIIFILPKYHEEHTDVLVQVVAAIFFILGPIDNILTSFIFVVQADTSASKVIEIERELDMGLQNQTQDFSKEESADTQPALTFEHSIELENLYYAYPSKDINNQFNIGPFNLKIRKGEIIFIVGGNGCGKSTFLKMFTGLYMPKKGTIYLDRDIAGGKEGTAIRSHNHKSYRNLFTTIFTDFHLFDNLYGLEEVDELKVNQLLERMELPPEKVHYKKGGYSTIKLSSGQKKRVALVTSIMEDKEIYIYDEVAADLDPWFRERYYYDILPALQAKNKTVFVVSHDKSFWHVADRVLELKDGQFQEKNIDEYNMNFV